MNQNELKQALVDTMTVLDRLQEVSVSLNLSEVEACIEEANTYLVLAFKDIAMSEGELH